MAGKKKKGACHPPHPPQFPQECGNVGTRASWLPPRRPEKRGNGCCDHVPLLVVPEHELKLSIKPDFPVELEFNFAKGFFFLFFCIAKCSERGAGGISLAG